MTEGRTWSPNSVEFIQGRQIDGQSHSAPVGGFTTKSHRPQRIDRSGVNHSTPSGAALTVTRTRNDLLSTFVGS
jgi:hypothetical protein